MRSNRDTCGNLETYLNTTSIATAVSKTPSRNAATATTTHEPVPRAAAQDPLAAKGTDVLSGRLVVVNTLVTA